MPIKEAIRRIRNYIGFLYGTKEPQEEICEALNMAITALREKEERENPRMLTHTKLNELNECPIYVVPKGPYKDYPPHWCVKYGAMVLVPGYEWTWSVHDYGKNWIAYRHKPKEDAK